jgi:hypothetical protein
MDDPGVPDTVKNRLFGEGIRSRREERIRAELAERGYRLMYRGRGGQYWVIFRDAQTLDQIEHGLARVPR